MIAIFLVLLKNIFSPFKSDPKHFLLLESCFASPRQPGYESSFSDVSPCCRAVLEARLMVLRFLLKAGPVTPY